VVLKTPCPPCLTRFFSSRFCVRGQDVARGLQIDGNVEQALTSCHCSSRRIWVAIVVPTWLLEGGHCLRLSSTGTHKIHELGRSADARCPHQILKGMSKCTFRTP